MKSSDKKEMNVQFVINTQEEEATWDTATTRDSDIPWGADTLWAYASVQDGAIPAVENLCNTHNRWEAIDKRDNRLVALAKAGDTDAMAELFRLYAPMIAKYDNDRHLAGHGLDVIDILWIALARAIHTYDLDGNIPFTCHLNNKLSFSEIGAARDLYRLWKREMFFPNGEITEAIVSFDNEAFDVIEAETTVLRRLQYEKVDSIVEQLPEKDKKIILGIYFEGLSMTELAHRMGISRQAVSQHHTRCKKKLRYLLLETKLF
ncbi:RNA polymerase sigma factor [uncultured Veillonella sp.]|uniref:RNA polymerase sigma factor n=1 Tax=uncultured Veillonella sp. TaxID=159268 RepID=UPI0025918B01|nr:sigma-70 family RNA polymerase sigma factor [uncultured Veillonella sp.]